VTGASNIASTLGGGKGRNTWEEVAPVFCYFENYVKKRLQNATLKKTNTEKVPQLMGTISVDGEATITRHFSPLYLLSALHSSALFT